ncbi:hypothetical protein JX265_002261 [Neoarthrinium moseri]|uniref:Uncharacterized protein n=1 Tax=Neoarthrinium moseri TaxID=1658444 RepID=A0A9P9WTZ1_9PEZI|nr:hypothetical protein JX265_002261 [Neoarthrinium moseri]
MSSGLEAAVMPSPQQKQLTSTSLQKGRPSVADLRRSFEQTNTGTQRNAHSFETPRHRLDMESISIRRAAGNSVDRNSHERKDVETEVFKTPSAHRTNKLETPPGTGEKLGELKPRNTGLALSGQIPDGESTPTSAIRTPPSFPPETCSASHNFIEHPVEPPFDENINSARTYHQNQYERFLVRLLEREETSCVTGSNSVVHEVEAPVPTAPTAVESHHPIRRVWRRISSSFAQSLEGGHENSHYRSSYQESSTSFDHSRSPHQRSLFPLLPARKSFAFMQRFSSNGTHNLFGLDGANQSVPDADIFMNPDAAHGTTNLARHPSHTSTTSHNTSLPAQDELRRLAQRDAFRDKQTQKKRDKELAKHERRERRKERRLAKQAGKQTRRTVSRAGSTAEAETSSTKERAWGQQTASGFMVRQARLGSDELQSPKPYRPGQVKKIVNMYKEKSNSLLRIASGHWGNSTEQVKGKGKEKDKRTLY